MATEALPDRYEVARRGTPDPDNARYYVLDFANDFAARVALRSLVRGYRMTGRPGAAAELEAALDASQADFAEQIRRQNDARSEATKKASKGRSTRTSSSTNRKSVPMS